MNGFRKLQRRAAALLCLFVLFAWIPARAADPGRATFAAASTVRSRWTSLAGTRDKVKEIRQYTESEMPSGVTKTTVSSADSALPIYSWFEDGVIWYWSEDPRPMLNADASYMFNGFTEATWIDAAPFDTSKVTDMEAMFANCPKLEHLDVSGFDTSNVRCMYCMFIYDSSLKELDVSNFNTTKSTSTSDQGYGSLCGMFYGCSGLTSLDLSSFDMTATSWTYHTQNMFISCNDMERLTLGPKCRFNNNTALSGNWTQEETGLQLSGSQLVSQYTAGNALKLSGTWIRNMPEGHYYRTDGSLGQRNLWEVHTPNDRFKGYCLNLNRHGVGDYLDRIPADDDEEILQLLCTKEEGSVHGSAPLGGTMREALITLIYYGWPNDAAGIQRSLGLDDQTYMEITQNAVWDFTDRYDLPAGPTLYTGKELQAYERLVAQRYANIQDAELLFLYKSWDPSKQNLLSIMGLDDKEYGGVSVTKWNEAGNTKLAGAEFTVYDSAGNAVGTMVTGANGEAYICRTDHSEGLPLGKYTVKETKAPAGYLPDDAIYAFEIREANTIVTIGYKVVNGETQSVGEMYFHDKKDENYEGGGIGIVKKSDTGKMLTGAEFTVYSASGEPVAVLVTNAAGVARTGEMDLPLGTYTIRETKTPDGYKPDTTARTVSITKNMQMVELNYTNESKKGSVELKAKKTLDFPGRKIEAGEYTFTLFDDYGNPLQIKTNDANGNVVFDPIEYTADDLGYKNYTIIEEKGEDRDIHYDLHTEKITVTIYDTGDDELSCTVIYDDGSAEFKNRKASEYYDVQLMKKELHADKALSGALLELREEESGRVLKNWVSDGTPLAVNLEAGTYILAEKDSPEGYDIAEPVRFTLNNDGTITCDAPEALEGNTVSVTMRDRLTSSTDLQFRKIDGADGSTLSGGVFLLTGEDPEGNPLEAEAVSDEKGIVSFSGIPAGDFLLTETQPPEGYEGSGPWNVSVACNRLIARTPNINQAGVASGDYPSNQVISRTVKAAGNPDSIHVELRYQTEDGYDYLRLRDAGGNVITRDLNGKTVGDTRTAYLGYLWGGMEAGIIHTLSLDLPGDTVTFELNADQNTAAYGFYAVVTTPEKITVTDQEGNELNPENGLYSLPNTKTEKTVYRFSFTKRWEGGTGEEIRWKLYDKNGKEVRKDFTKKVISSSEWYYEAEFEEDTDGYYIVEELQDGYDVLYLNSGTNSKEDSRLFAGNVLVNRKRKEVPKTGDPGNPAGWLLLTALGLGGLAALSAKRKRTGKQ